jgi:mannose/fructose/N-acetylgalactosamine-specific phosphotransferase system component IIC
VNVFVLFLLGWFLVGGTALGDRLAHRPIVVGIVCAVIAGSFYSLRVAL